ncbi:type IV secretion system DNA-binding domain-containing protein [Candidatus Kaiserbacteria bacterium]|nr:type IV secretion system DNA-binding domain-containing protein [Candidatus Kaiserbacteria bacterium]
MTVFEPEKITFFAKTDARGKEVAFGIKAKDRQRHMYVVGKTGMGKSTLLENMAAQDIQNGEGMAFIDPHGSAAETLLEYVPEHRVEDVIYFAPFDLDNPISFNVMEDVGPDKRHLVVSGLMSTFKKIWVDQWSSRMEYILTNALLVLIEYPDTTLLSVNRLFSDKAYRKKVVDYCKDPAVKSFWVDEFANYTDRFAAEALPAIQNKIGQFTGNPLIRNIVGQPHSSFDIRKIMDEKKILIMNLSKGLIGETNANLLGSMLTTRIYLAAMSRANLHVSEMKKMPNFYFYVDEFQSFANATFADILSEARKYHLNLIIAHQYIEQMEESVRNAVFGNVGTTIAFRVGPFDAEVLETVFAPRFEATDLVNLGFAQIYLTLMIDGIGSQPFSASTLPPVALPRVSCREMVINSSRKVYAKDRVSVEKLVDELHTPERPEPAPKKNFNEKPTGNYQGKNSLPADKNNTNTQSSSVIRQNRTDISHVAKTNTDSRIEKESPRNSLKVNSERRPPVVEKTPEDLRNILLKMTQKTTPEKKNNSVSVSVNSGEGSKEEDVPAKTSTDKPEKKLEVNRDQSTFKSRADQPKDDGSPKPDLKSALADVLKKAGATADLQPKSQQPTTSSQSQQLSEVKKQQFGQQTVEPLEPRPAPPLISHRENKPILTNPVTLNNLSAEKSQIRKVVVEHRKRRQIEDNETGESGSTIRFSPRFDRSADQVEASSNKSVLDVAEIKRMLRHNDNERSPFN